MGLAVSICSFVVSFSLSLILILVTSESLKYGMETKNRGRGYAGARVKELLLELIHDSSFFSSSEPSLVQSSSKSYERGNCLVTAKVDIPDKDKKVDNGGKTTSLSCSNPPLHKSATLLKKRQLNFLDELNIEVKDARLVDSTYVTYRLAVSVQIGSEGGKQAYKWVIWRRILDFTVLRNALLKLGSGSTSTSATSGTSNNSSSTLPVLPHSLRRTFEPDHLANRAQRLHGFIEVVLQDSTFRTSQDLFEFISMRECDTAKPAIDKIPAESPADLLNVEVITDKDAVKDGHINSIPSEVVVTEFEQEGGHISMMSVFSNGDVAESPQSPVGMEYLENAYKLSPPGSRSGILNSPNTNNGSSRIARLAASRASNAAKSLASGAQKLKANINMPMSAPRLSGISLKGAKRESFLPRNNSPLPNYPENTPIRDKLDSDLL